MARLSVKSTYSLDLGTVQALERMAKRWKVSKSEAIRRAVLIAEQSEEGGSPDALQALDELQRSLGLTPARVREWMRESRGEREAASTSRERGAR